MTHSFSAETAKNFSTLYTRTVSEEIMLIHLYILNAAAENGLTKVNVGSTTSTTVNGVTVTGTPMTSNTVAGQGYYNTWQNKIEDFAKQSEMSKVIEHFEKLGYSIVRKSNDSTVFYWSIAWH